MEYPADFDTTGFPAGKVLATNRIIAVLIILLVVLIAVTCGILLWSHRSLKNHPFMVSVDSATGQWTIVGHQHGDYKTIKSEGLVIHSVIAHFIKYRFSISVDMTVNDMVWQQCDLDTDCSLAAHQDNSIINPDKCGLYCTTDAAVFDDFTAKVVPVYRQYALAHDERTVDLSAIRFKHLGGGVFQVQFVINSTLYGEMDILGFAKIERDTSHYPYNLGYYVSDFTAYRIQ